MDGGIEARSSSDHGDAGSRNHALFSPDKTRPVVRTYKQRARGDDGQHRCHHRIRWHGLDQLVRALFALTRSDEQGEGDDGLFSCHALFTLCFVTVLPCASAYVRMDCCFAFVEVAAFFSFVSLDSGWCCNYHAHDTYTVFIYFFRFLLLSFVACWARHYGARLAMHLHLLNSS
jgi:hypothetical protein